jgi:hypothetical protein
MKPRHKTAHLSRNFFLEFSTQKNLTTDIFFHFESFAGLSNLTSLSLRGNILSNLEPLQFASLTNLVKIRQIVGKGFARKKTLTPSMYSKKTVQNRFSPKFTYYDWYPYPKIEEVLVVEVTKLSIWRWKSGNFRHQNGSIWRRKSGNFRHQNGSIISQMESRGNNIFILNTYNTCFEYIDVIDKGFWTIKWFLCKYSVIHWIKEKVAIFDQWVIVHFGHFFVNCIGPFLTSPLAPRGQLHH